MLWDITVVHGTWGRGIFPRTRTSSHGPRDCKCTKKVRWFEAGSYFRERLLNNIDVRGGEADVCQFDWSGSNSIFERDRAGANLAQHLVARRNEFPDARQVIIGHSHGGNVAIRALAHLPDEHPEILLATLATPFVEIFPTKDRLPALSRMLAAIAAAGLSAWLGGQLLPEIGDLLAAAAICVSLIVFLLEIVLAQLKAPQFRAGFVTRIVKAASHSVLERRPDKLLVLRGMGDEAGLALAAGDMLALFNRWSRRLFFGLVLPATAIVLMIAYFLFERELTIPFFGTGGVNPAFFVIVFYATMYTLCEGLCRSVFGREMSFAFVDVQVSSNSAPDQSGSAIIRTIVALSAEVDFDARHSLYSNPAAADEIASWLSATFDGQPTMRGL